MKSEHRHELQTNELGKIADKMGGFFELYGNRIMIGLCVVSIVASAIIYWVRSSRAKDSAAWTALTTSGNAEDLADVWDRFPGTPAGIWSRVREGESRLGNGVQLMFTNVESGRSELKKSAEAFQTVVNQRSASSTARERALIGLARAQESLSDGTESDAIKTYEQLIKDFPESVFKKDAEARIAALKSGSGQEFYAWFAKYDRPKPPEKRPLDKGATDDSDTDDLLKKIDEASGKPLDTDSTKASPKKKTAPAKTIPDDDSDPKSTETPKLEAPGAEKKDDSKPAKPEPKESSEEKSEKKDTGDKPAAPEKKEE